MLGEGLVIDRSSSDAGSEPQRSELAFWGEWEPPSQVEPFPEVSDRVLPRFLHTPILDHAIPGGWLQNTDPFVFGPKFRYTICRQYREKEPVQGFEGMKAIPTQLAKLQTNSVILFGSCLAKKFVLDTVFVVNDFVDWNGERPVIDDGTDDEGIYRDATLNRLNRGYQLRLYNGVHYRNRKEHRGMFSFVPCMLVNGKLHDSHGPRSTLIVCPSMLIRRRRGIRSSQTTLILRLISGSQ